MGSLSEKLPVDDIKSSDGNLEASDNGPYYIDPVKEAQLLSRLDWFLTPVLMLVYLCCFLDRSNIGV